MGEEMSQEDVKKVLDMDWNLYSFYIRALQRSNKTLIDAIFPEGAQKIAIRRLFRDAYRANLNTAHKFFFGVDYTGEEGESEN